MAKRHLTVRRETWPIRGAFTISRGSRTEAEVVVVELNDGEHRGWAECVPYARYGETVDSVVAQIETLRGPLEGGLDRPGLQGQIEPGAARNAVDCALWDLEAKAGGEPAWRLAGLETPGPLVTAYTLSLGTPEKMAEEAAASADRPLLKVKLGGEQDIDRVRAIRKAAPDSRLIVDANEAWRPEMLPDYLPAMAELGVALIEQPLPAGKDDALAGIERPVPVCADESFHDSTTLDRVAPLYDYVNIKLDKTGGLTEALRAAEAAKALGLGVMVGCMIGTSLAMAPATLIGGMADFVDLDGPLLLAKDREPGLTFAGSTLKPPAAELWG